MLLHIYAKRLVFHGTAQLYVQIRVRSSNLFLKVVILLRVVPDHAAQLLTNKERLCCVIMDCTILADAVSGDLWEGFINDMEVVSRNLCFALHLKRTTLLSEHN